MEEAPPSPNLILRKNLQKRGTDCFCNGTSFFEVLLDFGGVLFDIFVSIVERVVLFTGNYAFKIIFALASASV